MILGVLNPWPNELSAEAEFILRLRKALSACGHRSFVADSRGRVISEPIPDLPDPLRSADAILVFDPRYVEFAVTCPIVTPVWVPPELLPLEARIDYLAALRRVDLFVGGYGSPSLLAAYGAHLGRMNRTVGDPAEFCSSVPLDYLIEPRRLERRRLFYAGVNSERIAHKSGRIVSVPGRHNALFEMLDGSGFTDFHGPRRFGGIEPWHGFTSYRGDIPLDGRSVLTRIADCGVSLAISSAAHLRYGIVSNRIFEAVAAGSVVISDDNDFVRRNFGDSVLYVDTADPAICYAAICEAMAKLKADPAGAYELACRSQRIFRERLTLDAFCANLDSAIRRHAERRPAESVALVIDSVCDLHGLDAHLSDWGYAHVAFVGEAVEDAPPTEVPQSRHPTWEDFVAAAPALGIAHFTGRFSEGMPADLLVRLLDCARARPEAGIVLAGLPDLEHIGVVDPELHVLRLHFDGLAEMRIFRVVAGLLAPGRALFRVSTISEQPGGHSRRYHAWLYDHLVAAFAGHRGGPVGVACSRSFSVPEDVDLHRVATTREIFDFVYEKACAIPVAPALFDRSTAVVRSVWGRTSDVEGRLARVERKIERRRPLRALKRELRKAVDAVLRLLGLRPASRG
jgi:hypothetical protein